MMTHGHNSPLIVGKKGAVGTVVINRPEKHNLLTSESLLKMAEVFDVFSRDETVRVVVMRGAGDSAFSAGYDIDALPTRPAVQDAESLKQKPPMERAIGAIRAYPYPVIAMVNGHAHGGGCELALACDIRVAAKRAKMGMPPAKLGLVYPYDGYRRFLSVLGLSRTLEIFLTGRRYESGDCLKMGLVNYVVEDEDLETFTFGLAEEISQNAPLSLKGTKAALYKITEYPVLRKEDEDAIRSLFIQSLQSEDVEEGKQAFREKRKPRFKGR